MERGIMLVTMAAVSAIVAVVLSSVRSDPAISNCLLQDLSAVIQFNAEAGNIDGILILKNVSDSNCKVNAANYPKPNYDPAAAANLAVDNLPNRNLTEQTLTPGQMVYAKVSFIAAPQCNGNTHQANINFSDEVAPGQVITFTDAAGNQNFKINVCDNLTEVNKISIYPWSLRIN
jgi:hypothetical protein